MLYCKEPPPRYYYFTSLQHCSIVSAQYCCVEMNALYVWLHKNIFRVPIQQTVPGLLFQRHVFPPLSSPPLHCLPVKRLSPALRLAQNIEETHVRPASHSSQVITRCAASILRSLFLKYAIQSQFLHHVSAYLLSHMHLCTFILERCSRESYRAEENIKTHFWGGGVHFEVCNF